MTESDLQQLIQIEGPKHHCLLMRNNSGCFTDKTGRLVRFGLNNVSKKHNDMIKSSDLIGFTRGIFTAVEVKTPGWIFDPRNRRESAQKAFIDWVLANNGFAGFAQSIEDFKRIIGVV